MEEVCLHSPPRTFSLLLSTMAASLDVFFGGEPYTQDNSSYSNHQACKFGMLLVASNNAFGQQQLNVCSSQVSLSREAGSCWHSFSGLAAVELVSVQVHVHSLMVTPAAAGTHLSWRHKDVEEGAMSDAPITFTATPTKIHQRLY